MRVRVDEASNTSHPGSVMWEPGHLFGYDAIMAPGGRLVVPVLLLLMVAGCTSGPPQRGIAVPPPLRPISDDLTGYQNVDLCQIIDQHLPGTDGPTAERPTADNAATGTRDDVPNCRARVDSGSRIEPTMEIALGTPFSPDDRANAIQVDADGTTLYLGQCANPREGGVAARTIYRPLNGNKAISVTFTMKGDAEHPAPTTDEAQRLCDQVADVAKVFAQNLKELPFYDKSVTAHDPCAVLVDQAATINATKIGRSKGAIACDLVGDKIDVRVEFGVPRAGAVQGDYPVDDSTTMNGVAVAEQKDIWLNTPGHPGYCAYTWQAFPNSAQAEESASVVATVVPGASPMDVDLCGTARSFVTAVMRELKH